MIAILKNWAKGYPEQAFLVVFNTGVFAWLRVSGSAILTRLGLGWENLPALPQWLLNLTHNSLTGLQNFFGHSAWTWLVVSMLLTLVLHFIKGLIKFLLFLAIVAAGIYLVYRHQSLLGQLPG